MMQRILVAGKYYHPFEGGIESNTKYVSEYAAQNALVTVVCFNHAAGGVREIINGVHVVRYHPWLVWKSQPVSLAILWALMFEKADVIHFHAPNVISSLGIYIRCIWDRRVRLVITHHMDIFDRPLLRSFAMLLYRALLRRSESVIVTSRKNAVISKDIPVGTPVLEVPLGIDLSDYNLADSEKRAASEWIIQLAKGRPVIGFVGRHARYKGLEVLVRAVSLLEGVHAVIGGDGPYRDVAGKVAAECGVQDRVHFLGHLSHQDKLKLLSAIDVFAFPSTEITEAFGISQLEAMAMGAPVVATNLPTGVTDIAINDETAVVVEPGDHVGLAAALQKLLSDNTLSNRLAQNARKRVEAIYTNEIMSRSTVDILTRVASA